MGKSQENNLFLPSGCLTPQAIQLFNDGKLTGENLKKIRRHLEKCSLCKEAVEGFILMPDHVEQEDAIQDIRKGLLSLLNEKRELSAGGMKIRRVYKYVAAAASVIIIAGMFSIYHFLLRQDNNMIADNIEAKKAVPETISENQLQPSREKEIVTIEKQEEIEEPEVLTDEVQVYEISGVEVPEETKQKKSVVTGVAAQPEPAVFDKQSEIQPQFIVEGYEDFDDYIRKNIRYPEAALTKGISGNVKVEFFVNKKGKVIEVSVVEGIDEIINNEAIRVVSSSPRWIAAEIKGEKITRKMTVTVEFYFK